MGGCLSGTDCRGVKERNGWRKQAVVLSTGPCARRGQPGRVLTLSLAVATAPSLLRVVMSPAGEAFVAWDGNQRLQARFISPAGKPGPVLSLGDGGLQMPGGDQP